MSIALWIAKRQQLMYLVKKVSDAYGGDDVEWLREYAKDVAEANKDDLQKAIDLFEELLKQAPKELLKTQNKPVKTYQCEECGYRPPFCRFDLYNKCSNIKENVPQGT